MLLLAARACIATSSLPHVDGYTYRTWSIADGLPDQSIDAIAQTPDGYLWLGTPHGLARFDGLKFERYDPSGSHLLQEVGVSCLLVTAEGDLLVGSVGGGIIRLSRGSEYRYDAGLPAQKISVRSMFQDANHTVWAATGHGLYRLNGVHFERDQRLGNEVLTSIVPDGSGGLWLAGIGLFHCRQDRCSSVALPYSSRPPAILGLAYTPDGVVWVGSPRGLLMIGEDAIPQPVPAVPGPVRALHVGSGGMLWIGTVDRGLVVRQRDGTFGQALGDEEPMARTIHSVIESADGGLWLGTTQGLLRLSQTGMDLLRVSTAAGSDFGSLFVDRKGTVYLSAGKLRAFPQGSRQPIDLPQPGTAPVRAYFEEASGAHWVGTIGDGAYRLENGSVQHFTSMAAIRAFQQGADGTVWIASDGGIASYQNHRLQGYGGASGAPPGAVRAMALTHDGTVWIGSADGLFAFRDGHYVTNAVTSSIGSQRVWSLHATEDDELWIGTENGFYLVRNGHLVHFTIPQSPDTPAVLSILEDTLGRVLIGQPGRILRMSRSTLNAATEAAVREPQARPKDSAMLQVQMKGPLEVFPVAEETGAELYGTIPSAAQPDPYGGAWFATYPGLLHIGPSAPPQLLTPPRVVLESVTVNGQKVEAITPLRLPPAPTALQIQTTPIQLSSRSGLLFHARMLGSGEDWNELRPGEVSSWNHLPPGHYTYRAEANWLGSSSPPSTVEIDIIKEAPLYQKAWFLVLCSLLGIGCVYAVTRYRARQIELQYAAAAAERTRVAREMHDTLLQGCIGVSALLEAAQFGGLETIGAAALPPDPAQDSLLRYARDQIAETIHEARTAIWNMRVGTPSITLNHALRDLLERVLNRSEMRASFEDSTNEVQLTPAIQHEVVMATREALRNAVTHSRGSHLLLTLAAEDRTLVITVSDDGIGFLVPREHDVGSMHFGLATIAERMERLRGSHTIASTLGKGTVVTLRIPYPPAPGARGSKRPDHR